MITFIPVTFEYPALLASYSLPNHLRNVSSSGIVHLPPRGIFKSFGYNYLFNINQIFRTRRILKCIAVSALILLQGIQSVVYAQNKVPCDWQAWNDFKRLYISNEGRVIDPRNGLNVTTSEGQSYGMFFALTANDMPMFNKLLNWTQKNLAKEDLSTHLPAWLYEKKGDVWQVTDNNSASDADLWIAYSLLEAGRLWKKPAYSKLGKKLLDVIYKQETAFLKGFGKMVLPGKQGFVHVADDQKNGYWRLNPSYTPPQLLARFSHVSSKWHKIAANNYRFLLESTHTGLAPDWVDWDINTGFKLSSKNMAKGSEIGGYDAIRVYLWIGMLSGLDPHKSELLTRYQALLTLMQNPSLNGLPPQKVNIIDNTVVDNSIGPIGFSAALLPFLQNAPDLLKKQQMRLKDYKILKDEYYNSVLLLFGQGFDDGFYRFNREGKLLPAWSQKCIKPH